METLVVADTKMVEYHGSNNIEKYVLTVMNMVSIMMCNVIIFSKADKGLYFLHQMIDCSKVVCF